MRPGLHPQVAELLSRMPAAPGIPLDAFSDRAAAVEYLRAARAAVGREPTTRREPVALVRDMAVASGTRVRMYHPVIGEPLPALVYLHGGGWVLGNLDMQDELCRRLAIRARALVISVDYRLAPEYPFPAAIEDGLDVVRWTTSDDCPLPVIRGPVAIAGTSSGGNLAAAIAIRCRDEGIPLALQVLMYPVLDCRMATQSYQLFGDGPMVSAEQMRWYWGQYIPVESDRHHPHASPVLALNLAGLAPAVFVIPGCDPLRDEAEDYARRLAEAEVPVRALRYPGQIHSFLRFLEDLDDADRAVDEMSAAVRELMWT